MDLNIPYSLASHGAKRPAVMKKWGGRKFFGEEVGGPVTVFFCHSGEAGIPCFSISRTPVFTGVTTFDKPIKLFIDRSRRAV